MGEITSEERPLRMTDAKAISSKYGSKCKCNLTIRFSKYVIIFILLSKVVVKLYHFLITFTKC